MMRFLRRLFGSFRPSVPEVRPPLSALPQSKPDKLLTLDEIREWVEFYAGRMSRPLRSSDLPTYGRTADELGRPHIEVDTAYHYVTVERGAEIGRKTTSDLDELLYWIFRSITFNMTGTTPGVEANGHRRILFRRQLEMLASLNPAWVARCRGELLAILAQHPFTDGGPQTID